MRKLATIVLSLAGLAACATVPGTHALQTADYGSAPASNHAARIRAAFSELLIDPASARYDFGEPEHGWGRDDKGFVYGWVVWTRVDSKNQFGAFTGWKTYKVLLVGDAVHSIYLPAGNDLFGNPQFEKLR